MFSKAIGTRGKVRPLCQDRVELGVTGDPVGDEGEPGLQLLGQCPHSIPLVFGQQCLAARRGKRDQLAESYLAQMANVKDITDVRQPPLLNSNPSDLGRVDANVLHGLGQARGR
ncbi:hypothetical protein FQZ97_492690 [compost metagenome]